MHCLNSPLKYKESISNMEYFISREHILKFQTNNSNVHNTEAFQAYYSIKFHFFFETCLKYTK